MARTLWQRQIFSRLRYIGQRALTLTKTSSNNSLRMEPAVDVIDGNSLNPLHLVARNGHEGIATILLEHGVPVDVPDSNGWTPLHTASYNAYEGVVRWLVAKGANVNATENVVRSAPLLVAGYKGNMAIIRLLIQSGANVNYTNNMGWTQLWAAAEKGHEAAGRHLLACGVNPPDSGGDRNQTALHIAASNGNSAIVQLLIDIDKEQVNARDKDGLAPVHDAAGRGNVDVVRVLIENGVDVNAEATDGWKPLFCGSSKWSHGNGGTADPKRSETA